MASTTFTPNSTIATTNAVDQASGTTDLHSPLTDASDATYTHTTHASANASCELGLTDLPANAVASNPVTALSYTFRTRHFIARDDDSITLLAQILDASNNALTNQVTVDTYNSGGATSFADQTGSFTIQGTPTEGQWNGAKLRFDWTYNKSKGGDGIDIDIAEASIAVTYTAEATTETKTASVNALLAGTTEKTTSTNALLQVPGNLKTASANAVLIFIPELTASINAFLKGVIEKTASVNAIVQVDPNAPGATAIGKNVLGSAPLGILTTGDISGPTLETASVNAILKGTIEKTATADAFLQAAYSKTATVNAILTKLANLNTADLNAFLQLLDLTQESSANALLQKLFEKTATADAFLSTVGIELTANANAVLLSGGNLTASADARLVGQYNLTASANAVLQSDPVLQQVNSALYNISPPGYETTIGTPVSAYDNTCRYMAVFLIQETSGGSAEADTILFNIQFRVNGAGSWYNMDNTSTHQWKFSSGSAPFPTKRHADPVTSALLSGGTGTFCNGVHIAYPPQTAPQNMPGAFVANGYTELRFYIEAADGYISQGDSFEIRVIYEDGTTLNSYPDTLTFTADKSSVLFTQLQTAYRIYADDAAWGSSTALAAKNTAYVLPASGKQRIQLQTIQANTAATTTYFWSQVVQSSLRYAINGGTQVLVEGQNNTAPVYFTGLDTTVSYLDDDNVLTDVSLEDNPSYTNSWGREVVDEYTGNVFTVSYIPPQGEAPLVWAVTIDVDQLTGGDELTFWVAPLYRQITGEVKAVFKVPTKVTKTSSANAFLQKNFQKTALVNAILYAAGVQSSSANAYVKALGQLKIASLNALLQIVQQETSTTANGLLRLLANLETAQANALLNATFAKEASINAWIQSAGLTETTLVDVLLRALGFSETASADALLQIISTVQLDANAFLFGNVQTNASVNAVLQGDGAFALTDLNAFLQALGQISTADVNAILLKNQLRTAIADALLQKTFEKSSDLNAVLQLQDNLKVFVADAFLSGTITTSADVSALLSTTFEISTDLDVFLVLKGLQSGEIDAILKGTGISESSVSAYLSPAPGVWNEKAEHTSDWTEDTGLSDGWTEDSPASSDWNT